MPKTYGQLRPRQAVASVDHLARFLGGESESFTAMLLATIDLALPADRVRLRRVYPRHVAALECWRDAGPEVTAEELAQMVSRKERR